MSFFKKLKSRMFKSSSKIDEGLDAIVSDGGEEEIVTEQELVTQTVADTPDAEPAPVVMEPDPEAVVPDDVEVEALDQVPDEPAPTEPMTFDVDITAPLSDDMPSDCLLYTSPSPRDRG